MPQVEVCAICSEIVGGSLDVVVPGNAIAYVVLSNETATEPRYIAHVDCVLLRLTKEWESEDED